MATPFFGSGGWRGRLGDEIDAPGLRALGAAYDEWSDENGQPLLLAHDGRALGGAILDLLEEGVSGACLRLESPAPTPVLTWALSRGRGRGGLLATASHNPPADHGVKAFGPRGVALGGPDARHLEMHMRGALGAGPPPRTPAGRESAAPAKRRPSTSCWPAQHEYAAALAGQVETPHGSASLLYDAMHGTGALVLPALWEAAGVHVELLRGARDPRFGGAAPDPRPSTLVELSKRTRARGAVGFATDGDGDRFAIVDEAGRVCPDDEALALLFDFVIRERGARGTAVLSWAAGSLPERVARYHGLRVRRGDGGFRHAAQALANGRATLAGDESGGFAWRPFSHDKDGLLACVLLSELALTRGGMRNARRRLRRKVGPSWWTRRAVPASARRLAVLRRLRDDPPERVGGSSVIAIEGGRDPRWVFQDGFLMLRRSETEGVIRLYAEAQSSRTLRRRLESGAALLDDGARSR